MKASALTIAPILLHLYSLHYLLYEAEFLSLFLLRNALMRAKFQYVNHSIAKDSKFRISLALLINCFSFVFIFTQTIPTLTIHDRKFECPITHLGIKFFQHLKSEVMYFIRGHSVCCEVRHDLLIRLLSVQQFPCWKRLVCRS